MSEQRDQYRKICNAQADGMTAYALHLCRDFLNSHPNHGPAWCVQGTVLVELARYDDAKMAFKRALKLSPDEAVQVVLSQFGHLEVARGRFSKAREWFAKAHEADPDDATYLIFIGSTYFREGNFRKAENMHRRATCLSEGSIEEAYFNLGGVLVAQEQFDEARECYIRALEIDPEYEMARDRLSDVNRVVKSST